MRLSGWLLCGRPAWTLGGHADVGKTFVGTLLSRAAERLGPAALPAMAFVPYAGAVPDGGRHGHGGEIRRAPIV